MKTSIFIALLFVVWVGFAPAQEAKPQPSQWRGLVLNESTPEQAIEKLGEPNDKEKSCRLFFPSGVYRWLRKDARDDIFSRFEYKKLEGVKKAALYFVGDKLAVITIEPKKDLEPAALSGLYEMPFYTLSDSGDVALGPAYYEKRPTRDEPKKLPAAYSMVAVVKDAIVLADTTVTGAGAFAIGLGMNSGGVPGKVRMMYLISRALENRGGADALK